MKIKRTAIALAVCTAALSATFVGCGEEATPVETTATAEAAKIMSIPITGTFSLDVSSFAPDGYEDYSLNGVVLEKGSTTAVYHSENSNVPYIIVWTCPKNDRTLEQCVKEEADVYAEGYYQIAQTERYGGATCGTYYHSSNNDIAKDVINDGFYYIQNDIIEDGDNYIGISYYAKSEEVSLGDSGKKIWVPSGYSNIITDDLTNSGVLLFASYKDSALPDILIRDTSKEEAIDFAVKQAMYNTLLEGDYTSAEIEEIFNAAEENGWDEEYNREFFNAMDCDVEEFLAIKKGDLSSQFIRFSNDKAKYEANFASYADSDIYCLILRSTNTPFPALSAAMIDSIH